MDKVNISKRALAARIDRALRRKGEMLCKCRFDSRWYDDMGPYYIVDIHTNSVIWRRISLEATGQELGVLRPYEKLEG